MRAYPVGRQVQVPIRAFIYIYTLCIRAARALVSLYICAGAPELSMLENAISPKISSADTQLSRGQLGKAMKSLYSSAVM